MGSYLESGWVNDGPPGGGAYGPFQIQHPSDAPVAGPPIHGNITVSDAQNPLLAAKYMLPAYQAGMDPKNTSRKVNFPSTLWTSNTKLAAEYTAYNAEKPAEPYHLAQSQGKVDEAYNASLLVMKALGSSTQFIDSNCLSALSPNTPLGTLPDGPAGQTRSQVINTATSLLGTPYSWGGGHSAYGPTYGICAGGTAWNDCHIAGVDCSGLTRYAFHAVNVDIGGTAADQWHKTKQWQEPMDKAQPGDLLFWTGSDGSYADPGHVAIYVGGGKAVMAPQSGDVVKIADITTPFWQNSFVGATDPYQQ
jgi:cell wall-associated NlpC family hydrolase